MPDAKWIRGLSSEERIAQARASLEGAINVAHFLARLHESNRIIILSDTLAKQVPSSFAGNAYNNFTRSMLEIEIVRLCSLWDPAEQEAYSINTVVELIDSRDVVEKLANEAADTLRSFDTVLLDEKDMPNGQRDEVISTLAMFNETDAQREYDQTVRKSANAIRLARAIDEASGLKKLRNFRHKNIAHATAQTRLERKEGVIMPPQVRDAGRFLRLTFRTLERLDYAVRGRNSSWHDTQRVVRRDAEALWNGVSINVLR